MTKERAIAMIDEYLLEPNSIDAEWVEILRMSRDALKATTEADNEHEADVFK